MPKFASLDEFYASLPEDQERSIRRVVDFVAAFLSEIIAIGRSETA